VGTEDGTCAALANVHTMGSLINLRCSVQEPFNSVLLSDAPGIALHICHVLTLLQKKEH